MADADREHWDGRYSGRDHLSAGEAALIELGPPRHLPGIGRLLRPGGSALDVACGTGEVALWLASQGLDVWGVDVSPVAVAQARARAMAEALDCRFSVVDLDRGLPEGPPVDLIVCHLFRDARLDPAMIRRLRPGGMLALAALSEVGAEPGPFRVRPGELLTAFDALEVVEHVEADGIARLVAFAAGPRATARLDWSGPRPA